MIDSQNRVYNHRKRIRLICLFGVACTAGYAGCDGGIGGETSRLSAADHPGLRCPNSISLGSLARGQVGEARLEVENPNTEEVRVSAIETSCPCLTLAPGSARLGPKTVAAFVVRFDARDEPDFSGRLAIGVDGRDPEGLVVFRLTVHVEVSSR